MRFVLPAAWSDVSDDEILGSSHKTSLADAVAWQGKTDDGGLIMARCGKRIGAPIP